MLLGYHVNIIYLLAHLLFLLDLSLFVLVAMVVMAVIYVLIVKLATLNAIQITNYYRLYINDIHKAGNEAKYTKLNKKYQTLPSLHEKQ